jgi:hypothetical protein
MFAIIPSSVQALALAGRVMRLVCSLLVQLCASSVLHTGGAAADGPPPPPPPVRGATQFVDPRPALSEEEVKNAVVSYNGSASQSLGGGVIVVQPCVFYTENRYGNIQGDVHNINDSSTHG